jgi:uncharacterized protein YndB with AHSA1/START domain
MNHNLVVSESIEVNIEPAKAWKALTDPNIIKEYLFGTETVTDWNVGSEVIFQGSYGEHNEHHYRDKGVVLENRPNERLSYSYWSGFSGLDDRPEHYATVTYDLEKLNGKTRFTWTQRGFATEEGYQHSKNGMRAFLGQIKAIMER